MKEVLLVEAPDGFIVQGLVTSSGDAGTWSDSMGTQAKETLTFLDDDIGRFMDEAMARRKAAGPMTAEQAQDAATAEWAKAGYYETSFRVLGRYMDEQRPRDVFFFEQDGAFVVRLLMTDAKGSHHVLAEFTREDIQALVAEGPSHRVSPPKSGPGPPDRSGGIAMKALKTVAIALGVTLGALIVIPLVVLAGLFVWLKLTEESDEGGARARPGRLLIDKPGALTAADAAPGPPQPHPRDARRQGGRRHVRRALRTGDQPPGDRAGAAPGRSGLCRGHGPVGGQLRGGQSRRSRCSSPVGYAFVRFALAGVVLLAICRWREGSIRLPRRDILPLAGLGCRSSLRHCLLLRGARPRPDVPPRVGQPARMGAFRRHLGRGCPSPPDGWMETGCRSSTVCTSPSAADARTWRQQIGVPLTAPASLMARASLLLPPSAPSPEYHAATADQKRVLRVAHSPPIQATRRR